jgi:hypothetical protein
MDLPILTELVKLVNLHVLPVQDQFLHVLTVWMDILLTQTLMFVLAQINVNMVKLSQMEIVLESVIPFLLIKMESVFSVDVQMDSKIMDMEDVLLQQQ